MHQLEHIVLTLSCRRVDLIFRISHHAGSTSKMPLKYMKEVHSYFTFVGDRQQCVSTTPKLRREQWSRTP